MLLYAFHHMFSILMFLLIFVLMCVADSFIPLFPTSPGLLAAVIVYKGGVLLAQPLHVYLSIFDHLH
jgi:hypothetical protein